MRRFATPHPKTVPVPMAPHWRYILAKRAEVPAVHLWGVADGQPEGANGGCIMAGQGYTIEDRHAVEHWIAQRARGYVLDVPWHKIGCLHDGRPIPPPTPATRSG